MALEQIAEDLARSIGHLTSCRMVEYKQFPCTCGAAKQQAAALDAYQQWKLTRA